MKIFEATCKRNGFEFKYIIKAETKEEAEAKLFTISNDRSLKLKER